MERSDCQRNCWIAAAITGTVVLLLTSGIGDLDLAGGLFLGLMAFALFGKLLIWLACAGRAERFLPDEAVTGLSWQRETVESRPDEMLVSAPAMAEPIEAAARMPIMAGATPAPRPVPAPVTAADLVADEAVAEEVVADEVAPESPVADDLRRIKGVGPKLSVWLNENGVSRFAQIAEWDAATIADFAHRMGRMGSRIEADDWVGQAKLLAKGTETAHSRAVDRGEAT